MDARLLWLLWVVPLAGGLLAYRTLRRGGPAWLLLLAMAGYSLPLWLGVFALAYLRGYRHPRALAPFLVALFVSMAVGPVLQLKVATLQERGELRWPRVRLRYPMTLGTTVVFLGGPAFLWLAGERNLRLLGALLALGLALLLVFLLFERSEKKGATPD